MKTRSLAVALAATTLVLAACGSDSKTAATTVAPTTVAPTPAPAAGAGDIVAVAAGNPDFSTLVAAVKAAGLVETLQGAGPFTVFAPTNEAFAKLPAGLVDKLLLPANKDVLVKILTYHVVAGKVMAADVKAGDVKSVEGSPITIAIDGSSVTLNTTTKVTATDVAASNGVIHVIDSVIVPADVDVSKL
jgi:uncharacterized surface protein with fasciclin (FAS1) repeats